MRFLTRILRLYYWRSDDSHPLSKLKPKISTLAPGQPRSGEPYQHVGDINGQFIVGIRGNAITELTCDTDRELNIAMPISRKRLVYRKAILR